MLRVRVFKNSEMLIKNVQCMYSFIMFFFFWFHYHIDWMLISLIEGRANGSLAGVLLLLKRICKVANVSLIRCSIEPAKKTSKFISFSNSVRTVRKPWGMGKAVLWKMFHSNIVSWLWTQHLLLTYLLRLHESHVSLFRGFKLIICWRQAFHLLPKDYRRLEVFNGWMRN